SSPVEVCDQARGTITLGIGPTGEPTYFADGDTFTLSDGVNPSVAFEFDYQGDGASDPSKKTELIAFSGTPSNAEMAHAIADAINSVGRTAESSGRKLNIVASTTAAGTGGEQGAA